VGELARRATRGSQGRESSPSEEGAECSEDPWDSAAQESGPQELKGEPIGILASLAGERALGFSRGFSREAKNAGNRGYDVLGVCA
jgi:hypothetical protein